MDRFIPCRMGENLQAKFEAVSQKNEEEIKHNSERSIQLADQLGLEDPEAEDSDVTFNDNNNQSSR